MFYRKKKNVSLIQVGIYKTAHQQVEAVWLDKQHQPHFLLTDIGNISALTQQLIQIGIFQLERKRAFQFVINN